MSNSNNSQFTINLNIPVKLIDGTPHPSDKLNTVLCELCAFGRREGSALKFYAWAQSLHRGEPITVTVEERDLLIAEVNKSQIVNFAKAQLEIELRQQTVPPAA